MNNKHITLTTADTKAKFVSSDLFTSAKKAVDSLKDWVIHFGAKKKKTIKSIVVYDTVNTGVAGLNGSDDGIVTKPTKFRVTDKLTVTEAVTKTLESIGKAEGLVEVQIETDKTTHIAKLTGFQK